MRLVNKLAGSEGNVWKYVFEFPAQYPENSHDAPRIAEAVLYKYGSFEERTVICCSVQSGCKVGCAFCGTGENFIGQINDREILDQVAYLFNDWNIDPAKIDKLQIMFMSMGEPMDNIDNVASAIVKLNALYPKAALLLSTVGLDDPYAEYVINSVSKDIDKVGLQFSIHRSTDESRNKLIPYEQKLNLKQLVEWGKEWKKTIGRNPYINYVMTNVNSTDADYERLVALFDKDVFCVTLSVLCNPKKNGADHNDMDRLKEWHDRFEQAGYDVRTFDPAGKDDIGGGCGQLWFVQDHLKEHGIFKTKYQQIKLAVA
jgi:23S rRNA (adenine2503-C2)-methyltransferase